jgi:hypothetical protein
VLLEYAKFEAKNGAPKNARKLYELAVERFSRKDEVWRDYILFARKSQADELMMDGRGLADARQGSESSDHQQQIDSNRSKIQYARLSWSDPHPEDSLEVLDLIKRRKLSLLVTNTNQ